MRRRRASSGYVFCRQCRTEKTLDAKTCDICGTSLIWQPAQARRSDSSVGQDPFVGEIFSGLYRIEELISRDPNASLYRAMDIHGGKVVALKLLAPILSNDSVLMNRLRLEVQRQLHLDHPHIAKVKGVVPEGDYRAIVSQFISGISLDQLLYDLSRPLDISAIKSLLLPVLEAVVYAHQYKVQHLGIKPSNIVIESVGNTSHPYLTDFGISSFMAEGGARTSPGIVPGTLMYLSPEQCKALKSIDYRADIYALGVILYQMATGVVPFRAESAFEIMLAHVKEAPKPPKELNDAVSDTLQEIILKALAKDPQDRFVSVSELHEAIKALEVDSQPDANVDNAESVVPTAPPSVPAKEKLSAAVTLSRTRRFQRPASTIPPQAKRGFRPSQSTDQFTRLRLRLAVPTDWYDVFDANVAGGGLFVATSDPPEVGASVFLEIVFAAGPRVFLRGVVTWRRLQSGDSRAKKGVGIQAHPNERNKLAYLNNWVKGGVGEQRGLRRLPVKLRVTYKAPTGHRVNFTRDLNEEGLFIYCQELLPLGTSVEIFLTAQADDDSPLSLSGRVTRLVEDREQRGMGIQLRFPIEAWQRRYGDFVSDLEGRYLRGELPDDIIS
jgi:serine/threonine protein kinase